MRGSRWAIRERLYGSQTRDAKMRNPLEPYAVVHRDWADQSWAFAGLHRGSALRQILFNVSCTRAGFAAVVEPGSRSAAGMTFSQVCNSAMPWGGRNGWGK